MAAVELIKKGHTKDSYNNDQLTHLMRSVDDPIYFIENFVKIQHPIKGSIPFVMYDFQREMVEAFTENRYVVALTSRQMGKCFELNTVIKIKSPQGDITDISIGDFYEWQRFRQWAKTVPELQEFISRQNKG